MAELARTGSEVDEAEQGRRSSDSENEHQLDVTATLLLDHGRQAKSSKKTTNRRSKIFTTDVANLRLARFVREAIKALELFGTIEKKTIVPFTYYHKGRTRTQAASVNSEDDFGHLLRAINTKKLDSLNVEFSETVLHLIGISDRGTLTETGGLANHTGIPRVEAMSTLDESRARIIGVLEAKWKCKASGHTTCYVKDDIHARLTHHMLSTWASCIYDCMATAAEPPSLEIFDFASHQKTVSQRTKQTGSSGIPVGDPNLARVLDFLSASFSNNTNNSASQAPFHPRSTPAPPPFAVATPAATTLPSACSEPPSDLSSFLDYATEHHGIEPSCYRDLLLADRVGPDVIGDMEMSELAEYGIVRGDIHRLKRAARDWSGEEAKVQKKSKQGTDAPTVGGSFEIAFRDNPSPPPPDHQRTEAERAGRPRPGTEGNFCWSKKYPGEDEGGYTFWANMPSPTLNPTDPILAPPGTVQLRVASGVFIDVVRAPRPEVVMADHDEGQDDL